MNIPDNLNIITVDSNVAVLPKMIATKTFFEAKQWCIKLNQCPIPQEFENNQKLTVAPLTSSEKPSSQQSKPPNVVNKQSTEKQKLILYNTPISLADDISTYNFKNMKNITHFIYLDLNQNVEAQQRIFKNLQHISNPIIIINSSQVTNLVYSQKYIVNTGNCGNVQIADLLSAIVTLHIITNRVVKQSELINLLCKPNAKNKKQQQQEQIQNANDNQLATVYDIYTVMEASYPQPKEINDCHECN